MIVIGVVSIDYPTFHSLGCNEGHERVVCADALFLSCVQDGISYDYSMIYSRSIYSYKACGTMECRFG